MSAGLSVGNRGISAYYNRRRGHDRHDYRYRGSYYGASYNWEFYGGHCYPYGYNSFYDIYYHRYPYRYVRTYDYYPTWTIYVDQPAVETVYVERPTEVVYRDVATADSGQTVYTDPSADFVGPPAPNGNPPVVNGQLEVEPQERIPVRNEYLAAGERAFRAGDYAEARRELVRSVLDDPGDGFAQLAYGLCHFALGDYSASADALRRGLSLVPDVVDLPLDITRVYTKSADLDGQLRTLREHVESSPDDQNAWFVLGYVLYSSGQAGDAVTALTRAATIDPQDTFAAVLRDAASRVQ